MFGRCLERIRRPELPQSGQRVSMAPTRHPKARDSCSRSVVVLFLDHPYDELRHPRLSGALRDSVRNTTGRRSSKPNSCRHLCDALPERRVTLHSGDMGNTFFPLWGKEDVLEGVSRRGRTSPLRCPAVGRREDGRPLPGGLASRAGPATRSVVYVLGIICNPCVRNGPGESGGEAGIRTLGGG